MALLALTLIACDDDADGGGPVMDGPGDAQPRAGSEAPGQTTAGDGAGDEPATEAPAQPPGPGDAAQEPAPAADDVLDSAQQQLQGSIEFSVPSGTFVGQLELSLALAPGATADGVEVRYTLDGQPPSASSQAFAGPIQLTQTTQVRAQAFVDGQAIPGAGTALYIARSFDPEHDLPIVLLDNYGAGPLSNEPRDYVDVAFMAFELEAGAASLAATPQVASRAGFHIRGQSTASFDKTPYRVELRDNADEDLDWPLLGLPAEADWALRGPFADKALIRDAFFYATGAAMGMAAPRFAFAEVYLNTASRPVSEADYMGVYLILETIKNNKNRLDLQQLTAADTALPAISGGYIFKFEWRAAEEPTLLCAGASSSTSSQGGFGFPGQPMAETNGCWLDLEVVDPSPLIAEQQQWLTQHIQEFHDALQGQGFADPIAGYAAFIDTQSFVDQLIVNELGREMDAYIRSAYYYKDRDTKIFAGPLWDYNLAAGVGGFFENDQIAGWQYEQQRDPVNTDWHFRLMQDPAFVELVAQRWRALRQDVLSDAAIGERIDALSAPIAAAAARNFERWPNLQSPSVGPFQTPTEATWEGQVEFMRTWLLERAAWLDTQW